MKSCWMLCNFDEYDAEICEEISSGYKMLFSYVKENEESAKRLAEKLNAEHENVYLFEIDLRNPMSVQAVLEKMKAADQDVSLLINHLDYCVAGGLEEIDDKAVSDMIRVNVDSLFYTSKAVIPLFIKKREGLVCNLTDVSAIKFDNLTVYGATKAACMGFMKSLSKEYGRYHIRSINIVLDRHSGKRVQIGKTISKLTDIDLTNQIIMI